MTPSAVSMGIEKYPPQGSVRARVVGWLPGLFMIVVMRRDAVVIPLKLFVRIELRVFGTQMSDEPDHNLVFGNAIDETAAGSPLRKG